MYDPVGELDRLGVHVRRANLRAAWAVWVPHKRAVVLTTGLTRVQERCVLAHQIEHMLAGDLCAVGGVPGTLPGHLPGTRADTRMDTRMDSSPDASTVPREHLADLRAAAKLAGEGTVRRVLARAENPARTARLLGLTEAMLAVRLTVRAGVDHGRADAPQTMGA